MSSEIIAPGGSLVMASRALEAPERGLGVFPYQWIFPGPNARPVIARAVATPPAPAGQSVQLMSYAVPTGERFCLTGVIFGYLANDWVEGSGSLLFTLSVVGASTRPVEWLNGVDTRLGISPVQGLAAGWKPYPVPSRLEFNQRDLLVLTVQTVSGTYTGKLVAHLVGHTYPDSESGA